MDIRSFYFGENNNLYGILSFPNSSNDIGVLICPSIADESLRCHRTISVLQRKIADLGCCVFKFDYYGCGDSLGEYEDASIMQWMHDIESSVAEFGKRASFKRLVIIGLRIGATFAYRYALSKHFDSLILIAPVLNGKTYLMDLRRQHKIESITGVIQYAKSNSQYESLMGHKYSKQLLQEIEGISITHIDSHDKNVCILEDKRSGGNISYASACVRKTIMKERFWQQCTMYEINDIVPYEDIDAVVQYVQAVI